MLANTFSGDGREWELGSRQIAVFSHFGGELIKLCRSSLYRRIVFRSPADQLLLLYKTTEVLLMHEATS